MWFDLKHMYRLNAFQSSTKDGVGVLNLIINILLQYSKIVIEMPLVCCGQ